MFKAAVVGAGDAAREIAAAIEAAGVEVVLIDGVGLRRPRRRRPRRSRRCRSAWRSSTACSPSSTSATPGHAILATTTAGLSITEIGEITLRPDKVVGLHFAGPRVVEVVESDDTAPETAQAAANFVQRLRRSAVRCVECPGFVVNRVLASAAAEKGAATEQSGALRDAYGDRFQLARDISEDTVDERAELKAFVEACLILEEGIAGVRDIDLGTGRVFAKADARGLDDAAGRARAGRERAGASTSSRR